MKRLLAVTLVVVACGGTGGRTEVLVSAASSLTDAFVDLEAAFEAAHPEVDIVLNLGGSSTLAAQIVEGAPVDVFASADEATMQTVVDAELAPEPSVFARNRIVVAVAPGNPAGVTGLGDFAWPEPLLGICADTVPCGALARAAFETAGVTPAIDTHEPNVRAVLAKLVAGELDAGIVYSTDVLSTPPVAGIPIEPPVTTEHLIAPIGASPDAARFVAFVLSEEGRAILDGYGFETP